MSLVAVGEQQMPTTDQGQREGFDVGVDGDAAEFALLSHLRACVRAAGRRSRPVEVCQAGYAKIGDTIRETDQFHEPELWRFDWQQTYTRDQWLELLPTTGGLTRLEPEAKASILQTVGAAIDTLGGSFTMDYTTLAITAARLET